MGRGKVELKRIENKISRQVTFSKRRSGLLKKAREISVLCDTDVGLVVFSAKGRLFEFASPSTCMETILDRYERYSSAQRQFFPSTTSASDRKQGINRCSSDGEFPKLENRIQILQRILRNTSGEDLDEMSTRELQNLEQQIEIGLKRVRKRKNQVVNETISDLQKKSKALQEKNNLIVKKMKDSGSDKSEQQDKSVGPASSNLLTKVSAPTPLLEPNYK